LIDASDRDPLDLIERDLIVCSIIELGCPGRLVRREISAAMPASFALL